jgi:tetratricopeptide (TPR) repeat protein
LSNARAPTAIRAARLRAATPARFAAGNRVGLNADRVRFHNNWNNLGWRGRPGSWNRWGNWWGWNRWTRWPWWRWVGIRFWPYYWGGGYGSYGYGNYYYGYPTYSYQIVCPDPAYYGQYSQSAYAPTYDSSQAIPQEPSPATPSDAATATSAGSNRFADEGEALFREGRYSDAAQSFRHALVEDSQNGVLVQLLAQALFATGRYDEAAGAVQQSLMMLPQEQWGVVPANSRELYASPASYDDQLSQLDKSVSGGDATPAERFLLAYQLGFSGQRSKALAQLAEVRKAAPDDQAAARLAELWSEGEPAAAPASRGELPSPRPRTGIRSAGDL